MGLTDELVDAKKLAAVHHLQNHQWSCRVSPMNPIILTEIQNTGLNPTGASTKFVSNWRTLRVGPTAQQWGKHRLQYVLLCVDCDNTQNRTHREACRGEDVP